MKRSSRWRRFLALLPAVAMTVAASLPAAAAEPSDREQSAVKTITVFHVNDMHSRVEETADHIGYAKLSAIVKKYRMDHPGTLLLDAGDTFHGQTIANLVKGESVLRVMNEIGFDAMAPGNHDFNYGTDRLAELAEAAEFPVLSANTRKSDGARLLEPYTIRELEGLRIGIFGLTTPETAYKTHPNNVQGIEFADPVAEAKKVVAELKDKTDVIIALAHLGVDSSSTDTSIKVAEAVPEIDVIVDGHSHTKLDSGMRVGDVLIAQTGEYGKNIGKIELTVREGIVMDKKASLLSRAEAESVQPDAEVTAIVDAVKKEQEKELSQVIGSTGVRLDGERETVRKGESNLGNLIADAMLEETGADIAITNGGGIRASIEPGPVTKGQIVSVLLFGNYIQTKKVKGSAILEALELGVSSYPEPLGGFPHLGGMTVKFDPSRPKGERIVAAHVRGLPLESDREYVLATNDFMAAGGDQYTMWKDAPLLNDYSSLEESVIAYLQRHGTVSPTVENRIEVVPPSVPAAQPEPQLILPSE